MLAVLALGGGFGLYWFQPWRLFTSHTVNDTLPSLGAQTSAAGTASGTASSPPANTLLATGSLMSLEHQTSGTASLVQRFDGRVQLVLAQLATSDGPDLHVWLTDQTVRTDHSGWFIFDDGRYVELGALKGNRGNQVYDVPAGTDLASLTSAVIWCKRFAVAFGAAQLEPA